jgi:hypothetical protein
LTLVRNVDTVTFVVIGAVTAMTRATHMIWRRDEQVLETRSSFAHLRSECGYSQAKANPTPVDTGPPGT